MRDGLLAFVERENRPGKEEVSSRSKCQEKTRWGDSSSHLWTCARDVGYVTWDAWVSVCHA